MNTFFEQFKNYIAEETRILAALSWESVEILIDEIRDAAGAGQQIFIFGNGGSAANASHFAMELAKNASWPFGRIRVQSLNDNVPWMTAIANDTTFDDVFYHPLKSLGSKGDLVIALSTSGKSPNVIRPVIWAKQYGLRTVCIVGGQINDLQLNSDYAVVVPSTDSSHIENIQQIIVHMVINALKGEETPHL